MTPNQKLYLNALHKQNFWRLFVDGVKQRHCPGESKEDAWEVDHGHLAWATREPEGLHCMKNAAEWLFSDPIMGAPITMDLIRRLHQMTLPLHSSLIFSHHATAPFTQRFFHCHDEVTQNEEVIAYLNNRAREVQQLGDIAGKKTVPTPWEADETGIIAQWSEVEINERVPGLLQTYEEHMRSDSTEDEKIACIVRLMQDLENIHMFTDGNCRMIYLLLNKELIRINSSPVILDDPNDLDFFTVPQMVDQVKRGQASFNRFLTTGYPYPDCIPQETIFENIGKLKVIDIISQTHVEGVSKPTRFLASWIICDRVWSNFSENPPFMSELAKEKNNFKQVCEIWDKSIEETIPSENSDMASWLSSGIHQMGSAYFQFYLQASGIDSKSNQHDFSALLKSFVESMRKKLISLQHDYQRTIRDPLLCHLIDSEAYSMQEANRQNGFFSPGRLVQTTGNEQVDSASATASVRV